MHKISLIGGATASVADGAHGLSLDLVGPRHGNGTWDNGHVFAVGLFGDGSRDGTEAKVAVAGDEVLRLIVGTVTVGGHAERQEGEEANEQGAESGQTSANDGAVDLDGGPDGEVELDPTLVGRGPIVLNETDETHDTDDGGTVTRC